MGCWKIFHVISQINNVSLSCPLTLKLNTQLIEFDGYMCKTLPLSRSLLFLAFNYPLQIIEINHKLFKNKLKRYYRVKSPNVWHEGSFCIVLNSFEWVWVLIEMSPVWNCFGEAIISFVQYNRENTTVIIYHSESSPYTAI